MRTGKAEVGGAVRIKRIQLRIRVIGRVAKVGYNQAIELLGGGRSQWIRTTDAVLPN